MEDDNITIRTEQFTFETRDFSSSRERPAVERVSEHHIVIRFQDGKDVHLTGISAQQAWAQITEWAETISEEPYEDN